MEKDIAKAQKELAALEQTLTDESLYEKENKDKLQSYLKEQIGLKKQIEKLEEQWLQVQAEMH